MRSHILGLPPARRADRGEHAGLLLQRFLTVPAEGTERSATEKRDLFRAAGGALARSLPLYTAAFGRWAGSLPIGTISAELAAAGRLVVGLGSENVLETGIRLHHTYGLPVIPGSALKGLAAHYCDTVWGQRNLDAAPETSRRFGRDGGDYHRLLFGTTDDSGCVTFHDAWLTPGSPAPLALDVMTPHHPDWLDGKPPTDFDSPVPVPFVSVVGTFRVAVSWCGPAADAARNWAQLGFELLKEALREWGVGGKTSSGYGRLVEPPPPPPPPPPTLYGKARVTVLERRDVGGRATFKVHEAGRPKPGWLQYGTPPPVLPNAGDSIDVYWNNTELNNPQYRWDVPPHQPPGRPGNRPRR